MKKQYLSPVQIIEAIEKNIALVYEDRLTGKTQAFTCLDLDRMTMNELRGARVSYNTSKNTALLEACLKQKEAFSEFLGFDGQHNKRIRIGTGDFARVYVFDDRTSKIYKEFNGNLIELSHQDEQKARYNIRAVICETLEKLDKAKRFDGLQHTYSPSQRRAYHSRQGA